MSLAKYLGLLDALSAAPDGAGGLSAAAPSDTIGWYQDFTAFHLEAFYRSLASKARKLATDGDSEVAALGADLADIVSKASGKPLSWFRECLGLRQEDLGELVGRELSALKEEVGGLFDSALAQDPGLAKTLVSLETSAEGSSSLSSEGLRASALGIYRRAVCDRARADRLGRTLPKGSLSAKAVSFLGEGRLPSQDRLQAIGAKRSLIAALKRFKVDDKLFLDGYFESLVPNYLRFKRRSRLWYDSAGESPAKVEGLEIDLLILSVLEPGSELARLEAREPGPAPRSRAVARHRYLVRNQILIDDASDFSPVQIKAMASLAHPATGSVSLTADLDLSTTAWGLRSVDQLEWALPRHSLTELSVNYRQSRRLGELADALSGSPRPRLIGSFHEDHGAPKPVFAKGIGKIGDQAKWLSERILEIRDRAGRLPSIGVIAPESAVFKIAGLLARILEPNGVKTAVLGSIPSAGGGGRIWVLTPAQARGLEFEGALLVDPPSGPYLKLAVTRAAAYLGVCLSGEPSPELASLMGSIQEDWAQPEVPLETLDI